MKDEEMVLIAQPLLESRTCVYIECRVMNKTRLLIIFERTLSIAFYKQETHRP
jgi:hypothetical protein